MCVRKLEIFTGSGLVDLKKKKKKKTTSTKITLD